MTSIIIQPIRLIAPFTSLEKVANCNRKVTKKPFCWVDCVCDPQQSIADNWLGSWNDSAVKQIKEHFLPFKSSLNIRNLPKILNFYNWYDKQMSNLPAALQKILNCLLHLCRILDFNLVHASLVHDTHKCLTKSSQIQECPLRTSLTRIALTSLSPFPFKVR